MLSARKVPKIGSSFNLPKILTYDENVDKNKEMEEPLLRKKLERKETIGNSRRANYLNMTKYVDINKTIDPYLESCNSMSIKFDDYCEIPSNKPLQQFNPRKDEFIKSLMSGIPKLIKHKPAVSQIYSQSSGYTIKINHCPTNREIGSVDFDTILDTSSIKNKLNSRFESYESIIEHVDEELLNDANYIPSIMEHSSLPNFPSINQISTKKLILKKSSNPSMDLRNTLTRFSKNNGINQNNSEKQEIDEKQKSMNKSVIKYNIRQGLQTKKKPIKLKIQRDLITMSSQDISRNKNLKIETLTKTKSSNSKKPSKSPSKASKSPPKNRSSLFENYYEQVFVIQFFLIFIC